ARVGGICPSHRRPESPPVDKELGKRLLSAYLARDWRKLNRSQQHTYLRGLEIVLHRFGMPDDATVSQLQGKLEAGFPADSPEMNWLLCETLVFLQSPQTATKAIQLIESVPTQEEQIEYARSLRMLKAGWTPALRTTYFEWFLKAANYRGGASFEEFLEFIRTDAVATLTDAERSELKEVLDRKPVPKTPLENFGQM